MIGNSIGEASSPLRIAGGFFGTCLFDYEKFYLNRIYMITIWTLYACAIVRADIFFFKERLFTTIVGISVLHANGIIALVTAFFNASYKKILVKCFKALCIVDDTLKSLGVSLDYRTVYRESLITLALLLVISVGVTTFTSISSANFYSLPHALSVATMYFYPLFLTSISDFNYWIVLRSIENRFHQLNQYMNNLSADRDDHGRTFSRNACFIMKSRTNDDSRNDQSKVWIIMKLHQQLNKTSREINRMFGVDFGLQIGVYFFTTIELVSFLYLVYVQPNKIAIKKALLICSHITAQLLHLMTLILINCACENIQRKSNGMEAVLTNFINTVHDFKSCQEVNQFLMQVKQRPLQFTALGFINIGYKCLASMFTSIAETIIIMVQLGGMAHASYVHHEYNTTTTDQE